MKISTLKKRSDFEFANKFAKKISTKAIILQVYKTPETKLSATIDTENKGAATPLLFSVKISTQIPTNISTETLPENASQKNTQPNFGFTATKRIGGAVQRNRAKRRMRAMVQNLLQTQPNLFKPNHNYIFIARHETIERDFLALIKDAKYALYNVEKGA